MRKQTDFDFRVYPVGNTEGNYNHETLRAEIKAAYIDRGWEVMSTEVSQVSANVIFLAITLVKYEEVADPIREPEAEAIEAKRGPGRPKRVEEVVPA